MVYSLPSSSSPLLLLRLRQFIFKKKLRLYTRTLSPTEMFEPLNCRTCGRPGRRHAGDVRCVTLPKPVAEEWGRGAKPPVPLFVYSRFPRSQHSVSARAPTHLSCRSRMRGDMSPLLVRCWLLCALGVYCSCMRVPCLPFTFIQGARSTKLTSGLYRRVRVRWREKACMILSTKQYLKSEELLFNRWILLMEEEPRRNICLILLPVVNSIYKNN